MRAMITLRSAVSELPRLVEMATAFAEAGGLSAVEQARLLVILDELFSNVLRHGKGGAKAVEKVEVALSLDGERLTMDFADDGAPFDPLAVAPPDFNLQGAQRPVGGLGIHIVRGLVDEVQYQRGGGLNRLRLIRRINL